VKIGYLCSDHEVELHGTEGCSVHLRELTNALVRNSHDVFIVCACAGEERGAEILSRVYELGPTGADEVAWRALEVEGAVHDGRLERDLRSVLWNYWMLTTGREILERERPDALYERYGLFHWAGRELSRRLGIPHLLELNAPLCQEQDGYEKFVLTRTAAALEGSVVSSADAVIAVSPWLRDWAIQRGADPQRVTVVPNGVSRRVFERAPPFATVRERLGLVGARVVGFVGSFQSWHDVAGLVDAVGRLHEAGVEAKLLLVGSGSERRRLEQRARRIGIGEQVIFAGRVPHRQVPEYLGAMDVAVVPYRDSGEFFYSPMKLFESMACGTATVAAALGQIPEVIDHGRTGWLYRAGDAADLAESIRLLLSDRTLRDQIGRAGREEVLSRYTWEEVAERVVTIALDRCEVSLPAGAR
jgi:glycosyltransferase involved in cell wall biosynthesis